MLTVTRVENSNDELKRFWELDAFGVVDQKNDVMLVEEKDAVDQFNSSCNFDSDRYEVGLPWKKSHPPVVDNYQQVYQRLVSIERNLSKHPEKKRMYCEAVDRYIDDGHARAIDKEKKKQIISTEALAFKRFRKAFLFFTNFKTSLSIQGGLELRLSFILGTCWLTAAST